MNCAAGDTECRQGVWRCLADCSADKYLLAKADGTGCECAAPFTWSNSFSACVWDTGWIAASRSQELSDGGNAWSHPEYITAIDGLEASSGDVDTPETRLKTLVGFFDVPAIPANVSNYEVSVFISFRWSGGTDWRWQQNERIQLRYGGSWIGNNYCLQGSPPTKSELPNGSICPRGLSRNGSFSGVVSSGTFGISGGITPAMLASGNLALGLTSQSGNNGGWWVEHMAIRIVGQLN